MTGNLLQTIFNFYIFYICFLIIFFHFTDVWLDNLEPNLQKSWALTAVTEVKPAGVSARAMLNSLKKKPKRTSRLMKFNLGTQNESIAFILASPAHPPLPAEGELLQTSTFLRGSTSQLTAARYLHTVMMSTQKNW